MRVRREARVSLSILGFMAVAALLASHCDAYTCTTEACDRGESWNRCIACYEDSCTYEARDASGETVDTCDYDTSDTSARDACFDRANAAGEAICAGQPVTNDPPDTTGSTDPGGGCAQYFGCDACTSAGCAFCAPTGECQDYGSGQTCAEPTVDLSSDCEGPPSEGCAQYIGCFACTNADCAFCAPTGECQDYGSGQTCAEPTIDLSSDCAG